MTALTNPLSKVDPEIAGIIAKLMARLGYARYGVQGGDWGGIISRIVALNDAQHVAGLHLNFCIAGAPAGVQNPLEGVPADEVALMNATNARMENERAYQQIQGTKPQTLGVGLTDSPAGLAAMQFADSLASLLPVDQARVVRATLREVLGAPPRAK